MFSVSRNSTTGKRNDRQNASNQPDEDDGGIYDTIAEPNQQQQGGYEHLDDTTLRSGNREGENVGGNVNHHGLELTSLQGVSAVGGYTGLATTQRDNQGGNYSGLTPRDVDNEGGAYSELIRTQGNNDGGDYLEPTRTQGDKGSDNYSELIRTQGNNESGDYSELM